MKKFTPIEWQSFSLKKDVEIIVEKLRNERVIEISLLCEVVLIILGVALSNIFVEVREQRCFWITLSVLSIIPFLIIALRWILEKVKEVRRDSDLMDLREFIDAFDNEVAYYILMSESYYTMLAEALSHNSGTMEVGKISQEIIHFYYIQASYYFKKTIADLAPLRNIADKVLSSNINKIATKRLISLPRYYNAKELLTTISNYLENHVFIMDDLLEGKIVVDLNREFRKKLNSIDRAVSESLGLIKTIANE